MQQQPQVQQMFYNKNQEELNIDKMSGNVINFLTLESIPNKEINLNTINDLLFDHKTLTKYYTNYYNSQGYKKRFPETDVSKLNLNKILSAYYSKVFVTLTNLIISYPSILDYNIIKDFQKYFDEYNKTVKDTKYDISKTQNTICYKTKFLETMKITINDIIDNSLAMSFFKDEVDKFDYTKLILPEYYIIVSNTILMNEFIKFYQKLSMYEDFSFLTQNQIEKILRENQNLSVETLKYKLANSNFENEFKKIKTNISNLFQRITNNSSYNNEQEKKSYFINIYFNNLQQEFYGDCMLYICTPIELTFFNNIEVYSNIRFIQSHVFKEQIKLIDTTKNYDNFFLHIYYSVKI